MKNHRTFLLYTLTVLLLSACSEETKESHTETIKNPVGTYFDGRIDAIDLAKKSLEKSNKRSAEQNEQMKALYK